MEQGFHQIDSDISLPTRPDLLLRVITEKQAMDIANELGRERLKSLATVNHDSKRTDYAAASQQEAKDLKEVRTAIAKVINVSRPWIIGYASDFAKCLLTFI